MRRLLIMLVAIGACYVAVPVHAANAASVDILLRKTEADSMKLGAPGQEIVVEGAPTIRTTTTACDGRSGAYPIQNVLVVDPNSTYITSVIVCAPDGVSPGERLSPDPMVYDGHTEGGITYARYEATVISSANPSLGTQTTPLWTARREPGPTGAWPPSAEDAKLARAQAPKEVRREATPGKVGSQVRAGYSSGEKPERALAIWSWLPTAGASIGVAVLCGLLVFRFLKETLSHR